MTPILRESLAFFVAFLCLWLSGCHRPQRPEQPSAVESPAVRAVPGARVLDIVPEESWVRILVYRGGTLAPWGHNHVIASHDLRGKVHLHPDLGRSAFEIVMPVQSLTIDEAELRRQEGAEFPPEVPDSAKQGTRKNMLGEALLEGGRYPFIRMVSSAIEGTEENLSARVRVQVKDQWHELSVPIKLKRLRQGVIAVGEFKVTHAALGLEPFSAALGALKVQDEMKIRFEVTAR